ncbi:MAG: OOP family OmpA-OmpF porin [Crocinitomicaceae bacterium]|jgi:OOP family OmpA-OmpF porin
MKNLLTLLSFIIISIAYTNAQTAMAPMDVLVQGRNLTPIPNDKITFIGQKSGVQIVGITDIKGKFLVKLPAGDEYAIKVETIGDELDYNTFEVPTPGPGQVFNTVSLEITYELPTSVVLEDLHFDIAKYSIKQSSYESLDKLAAYLIRKGNTKIRVEGHTDDVGTSESNAKLASNRAKAVEEYLVKKGVKAEMITSVGMGEAHPIADNSTPEGKAKNRRTEIHIVD